VIAVLAGGVGARAGCYNPIEMAQRSKVGMFEVIFEPDAGGYHAFCPLLKGCHSYGQTKDEARRNIAEAIELWLESAAELGLSIPDHEVVEVAME
jgi:predicted RNase H-like HicB family nuclease